MSQDRFGRRLNARGGSPPSTYSNEEMIRNPQQRSFTDQHPSVAAIKHPRPVRSRTGPQLQTAGPRLPRNRFSSLQTDKIPLRTSSAVTLSQTRVVSPPATREQQRVPPVVTVAAGLLLSSESKMKKVENPITTRPTPKRTSIPGYRSRCVESDSEDELQTDSVHEAIKPSREMSSYMTSDSQMYYKPPENYLKQDSGIDQEMDTVQSPSTTVCEISSTGSSFDPKTYKKHLQDIQQSAIEWSRLQEGLSMLLPNSDGDTGFHHSIIHTKPTILASLIELVEKHPQLNTCINDQNSLFQTALHLSVHLQQVDMMKMLIKAGASLRLQDHKGNTPLHIACQQRNTACLDVLLSTLNHRTLSDLADIRNYEGNSCIHTAAYAENIEGLLKLRAAGVYIDIKTYGSNKTALHIAIEKGSFQLTQALIQSCGADFNRPMYSGCTPLHIAAGWNNIEIVAYLISLGADPYATTDEGDIPIDLVSNEGVRQFLAAVAGI